ncbi:c-type cytochrome [Chlorobium sp. BLA1]|uniref:c-type cytochrome n=1 Tax=Candidatus Chlorobium masyuteum TaxID=2716876 RepID=UPI001422E2F2|nr:c-type cytochrome [Candidatus Chlorobium masyuteum]NHQ60163.1 c-type cytochrome [Candidatus Chlorobium masyuteum]NTU44574.1 c-type cytochrome [Chlorobiaceae bacterium]
MHDSGEPQDGHNKIPKGWLLFFFGGVIFLVGYTVSYTPAISGWSFYKEYEQEMVAASKTVKTDTVKDYAGDNDAIEDGKEIFATTCAPCHNADATGGIGPNLTAAKLKYGSARSDLYETITKGRPNGMPSFLPQIGAEKISKVIAYLETLRKP